MFDQFEIGECEVHDKPIDLIDVGGVLDGNPGAVLFKAVGPEKAELVGNVMGARRRLARALDTDERGLLGTRAQRLNRLHPPIKVSSQQAPVQQVVLSDVPFIPITGDVAWFQYNTASFSGWPTPNDPYAIPAAYAYPDMGIVLLHLAPK